MKRIVLLLLVILSLASNAQEAKVSLFADADRDSGWVENYADYFIPYLYTIVHFSKFSITDKTTKVSLSYEPNARRNIGLAFSYKWLGLAGSTGFRFLNHDDNIYGKTKSVDFMTNLYGKRLIYDINLQYYKGFYMTNPRLLDSNWTDGMAYPQRPDIATLTIGGGLYYAFNNRKFSFRAPYSLTDVQLKSAGSWVFGGFMSYYLMVADSAIIPRTVAFDDSARLRIVSVFDMGAAFGYAYTWVIKKKYFVAFTFLPGFSRQNYVGYDEMGNRLEIPSHLAIKSQFRLSIGYTRQRFFWNFMYVGDSYNLTASKSSAFRYTSGYTLLQCGYRFIPKGR